MTVYVLLATVLVGLIYFALIATGFGLMASPLLGALAFLFFRLVEPEERSQAGCIRVLAAAGGGTAIGAALGVLSGVSRMPLWDATGIVLAVVAALALYTLLATGSAPVCTLCKGSAQSGARFSCPRCGDVICARPTCWLARYARCTRCHKGEIVIFPIADPWWDRRLGGRIMEGECSSCFAEAADRDLRECGQCHWSMCRRCWDYHNGTCVRCQWTMPNLPPALEPFLRKARRAAGRSRGRARDGRGASERPEKQSAAPRRR